MKLLSTLIGLLLPALCICQVEFKPGYIVLNNNDTLKGYLQTDIESNFYDGAFFSPENSAAKSAKYSTGEINTFGFNDGNVYQKQVYFNPAAGDTETCFAKLILKGWNSLFSFMRKEKTFFLITTHTDSTYLLYNDMVANLGNLIEKGNYKNILLFLSAGCSDPNILNNIENTGFSEKDLAFFIKKVNICVAPAAANEYLYKEPDTKFGLYIYAGGIALKDKYELTGRIMGRFSIPSSNRKGSINTGINYMRHYISRYQDVYYPGYQKKEKLTVDIISVPLTIQYNIINKFIQPYADAGISLDYKKSDGYLNYDGSTSSESKAGIGFIFALGVEAYITKKLFIKADWRYELLIHHPVIGVAYFF